ncbi:MAG: glucuronate isomerase, partial [Sphingobacteriales bacterium]
MKKFLDENFLLDNPTAVRLYHDFAKEMPIIDYHCHLSPEQIANDHQFQNITQAWLYGDHYKWRAMRTNGIDESYVTGSKDDFAKFEQWAATVPYTLRNPLYHWTHLELQRYFGIHEILDAKSAKSIYDKASEQISKPEYSVRGLLKKMNVKVVCTTDDPLDDLHFHQAFKKEGNELRMFPAWRPDAAMNVDDTGKF